MLWLLKVKKKGLFLFKTKNASMCDQTVLCITKSFYTCVCSLDTVESLYSSIEVESVDATPCMYSLVVITDFITGVIVV